MKREHIIELLEQLKSPPPLFDVEQELILDFDHQPHEYLHTEEEIAYADVLKENFDDWRMELIEKLRTEQEIPFKELEHFAREFGLITLLEKLEELRNEN